MTRNLGDAPRAAQPDAAGVLSAPAQRTGRSRLRRATVALAATFAVGCADTAEPLQDEPVAAESARLMASPPSPVALWHLDEDCSSTTVIDDSGNGAHGVRHNGAGCGAGRVDRAAAFDGADDRIEIPDRPAFHFTTQMTAAAWVQPSSTSGLRTIVNKWYSMDSYALFLQDGQFGFSIALPGNGWGTTVTVAAPASPGVWSHVAGVYDGTRVSLYVNGALVASTAVSAEPRALQDSTRPIVIGNHPSWNAYAGTIDEVRLYDVALTAAQVKALTRDIYHVATTGLDTNPGTLARPFKTLVKAGQMAQAGDTVYVRGGTYYTDSTSPVKLDHLGTEEEHIVFQPYPGESVVLDGSLGGGSNENILQIRGAYYDILGFEMRDAKGVAISLWKWDGSSSGRHIRIAGNTIHGSFKGAVYPGHESTHMRFENNVVYDNVKINADKRLFCHQGGWPSAVNLTRGDDVVVGNTVYENFGEGIGAYGTNHHVADNVLHDNYSVDLYLNNLADSTIERNFIYSLSKPAFHRPYCPDGVSCPDRPAGDTTCSWPGDLRIPAAAVGIALANEDPDDVLLDNNRVRNNIVVGPGPSSIPRRTVLQLSAWGGTGPSDMGGTRIENNTVVGSGDAELFGIRGPAPSTAGGRAQVVNNIFYQLSSDRPLTRFSHTVRIDFASNNWFGGNGSSSPGGSGQSASDVVGDPLLVNENGIDPDDFRLLGGSPVRNQGTLLADVQEDFFGTPRPQESAHDIGAHEVVAGSLEEEEALSGRPIAR
ncbi:LamG-like jellyroll fold domain-containing protein [Sorangium sp. So ce1014]|uniref:LamG-like jellyroll fold domain-containing protein n=1 Tax=Sorangium sp. So ce1014 TaxID=3133326 RepID=UPI003F601C92